MMNWQLHLKLLLPHWKQTIARKVCHWWYHDVTTHPKSVLVLICYSGFQPPVQRWLSRTFHPPLARPGLELLRCHNGAVLSRLFARYPQHHLTFYNIKLLCPSRSRSRALPGAGTPFLSISKLRQTYIWIYTWPNKHYIDKWWRHTGPLWTPEYQTGAPTWCPWTVAQVNRKFRAAAAWAIKIEEERRGLVGSCKKHASSKKSSTSRSFGDNKADTFSKKMKFLGGVNYVNFQWDQTENMVLAYVSAVVMKTSGKNNVENIFFGQDSVGFHQSLLRHANETLLSPTCCGYHLIQLGSLPGRSPGQDMWRWSTDLDSGSPVGDVCK